LLIVSIFVVVSGLFLGPNNMTQKFYYIYKNIYGNVNVISIVHERRAFSSFMQHNKGFAIEVPYSCVKKVIDKSILDRDWFNEIWPLDWPHQQ
jgi:sporulation protein YlmC with PRC-barrel domain